MLRLPRFSKPKYRERGVLDAGEAHRARERDRLQQSPLPSPKKKENTQGNENNLGSPFSTSTTSSTLPCASIASGSKYDPEQGDPIGELDDFEDIVVPRGAPTQLICEECESLIASILCEECNEVLCPKCAALSHLRQANGKSHSHIRKGAMRHLRQGDTSSVLLQISDHHAYTLSEVCGDSSVRPLEAPKINLLGIKSTSSSMPKYSHGDIIIVPADQLDTRPEVPTCPGWRCPELYGRILTVSDTCSRHGSEFEPYLRVELLGPASWDYGDEICRTWLEGKKGRQMQIESSRVHIEGGSCTAPLVKEKLEAMRRDKAVQAIRKIRSDPEKVNMVYNLGVEDAAGMIVSVPATAVLLLAERVGDLTRRRDVQLERLRKVLECASNQAAVGKAFTHWHGQVAAMIHCEQSAATRLLQSHARGWAARRQYRRMLENEKRALLEARRRIHRQFKYLTTDEERIAAGGGVTTGKAFFKTKVELNRFEAIYAACSRRAFKTSHTVQHLFQRARDLQRGYFERWVRLTRDAAAQDVHPLAFDATMDMDSGVRNDETACIERHKYFAQKIRLPPLQPLSIRGPAFNSWRACMRGPTPFSSWVVPGRILISAYPSGDTPAFPRQLKQPKHKDSASSLLLAGLGVFIGLCSQEECERHEEVHEFQHFEKVLRTRLKALSGELQGEYRTAKQTLDLREQELKSVQMLRGVETYSKSAFHALLAESVQNAALARRASQRAETAYRKLPLSIDCEYWPINGDDWRSLDIATLNLLCDKIEERVCCGEGVCLWTTGGHGWCGTLSAMLLCRWYGCTATEALQRVQIAHDSREDLLGSVPSVSCPHTSVQRQAVAAGNVAYEAQFTSLGIRKGRPLSSTASVQERTCLRGTGIPQLNAADPDQIIAPSPTAQLLVEAQAKRRLAQQVCP